MLAMQLDTRSLMHDIARNIILEISSEDDENAALRKARPLVLGWSGHADLDQPAFRILAATHQQLREWIIGSLVVPCANADPSFAYNWPLVDEPLMRILEERPEHLVPPPFDDWHSYLRGLLVDVVERIESSAQPLSTPWEEFAAVHVEHPVLRHVPLIGAHANMPPVTLPGHANTVRMSTPGLGVTMRMVVSPGRWDDAILHMPCGQSGHVLSAHYSDQHMTWADGAPSPMMPGSAKHTLTLLPAQ